jgi:hypothetical protein
MDPRVKPAGDELLLLHGLGPPRPSLPGLTRQSITFAKLWRSGMDPRVKPAGDERLLSHGLGLCHSRIAVPGLDPRLDPAIHHLAKT